MAAWRVLRTLLLVLASFGYLANGAQAHVRISAGESLDLMLCSTGTHATKTIHVEIPGEPAEETDGTACGACVMAPGIVPIALPFEFAQLTFARPIVMRQLIQISPRSPLWPGAPPHGPPTSLKA